MPIFPRKAGEDAGIDLSGLPDQDVQYAGSREPAWVRRAYFALGEHTFDLDIWFVERLDFPYAVLGRRGFFAKFREVAFLERIATPRVELRW